MRSLPFLLCVIAVSAQSPGPRECTFQQNPDEILTRQLRIHQQMFASIRGFAPRAKGAIPRNLQATSAPRRNLIDDYVFSQLEARGIDSAQISSDEEFLRRVTLDLTGRIPAPADIRSFAASEEEDKRDQVIEKLLASTEFVDVDDVVWRFVEK